MTRTYMILLIITAAFICQSSQGYVYIKEITWPKKDFSICFLDNNDYLLNNSHKISFRKYTYQKVGNESKVYRYNLKGDFSQIPKEDRTIFETSLTSSLRNTNIRVSGFENCNEDNEYDVAIMRLRNIPGILEGAHAGTIGISMGRKLLSEKKSMSTIVYTNSYFQRQMEEVKKLLLKLNPKDNQKSIEQAQDYFKSYKGAVFVHEFGHILGLFHEESSSDYRVKFFYESMLSKAQLKKNERMLTMQFTLKKCQKEKWGCNFGGFGHPKHSPFDRFSIMSYIRTTNFIPGIALKVYCNQNIENTICNEDFLDLSYPKLNSYTGYFSQDDINGIEYMYDQQYSGSLSTALTPDRIQSYLEWLKLTRELF